MTYILNMTRHGQILFALLNNTFQQKTNKLEKKKYRTTKELEEVKELDEVDLTKSEIIKEYNDNDEFEIDEKEKKYK